MHDHDDELGLACLFCGESLDPEAPDFLALDFTAAAGYGTFVCHTGCLRARAHDPAEFPKLETPPEPLDGEEPDAALHDAWHDLAHVLGHVHGAELDDPAAVTALARAIEATAAEHGVAIGHDADAHG